MPRRNEWMVVVGAVVGAMGCSDSVPPSAGAGLRLQISSAGSCPANPAQDDDVGKPAPDHGRNTVGGLIYDGEQGVRASCTVSGEGSFEINGTIRAPNVAFSILNGTIGSDNAGTGNISFSTQSISVNSTPCSLTAHEVGAGKLWASFQCFGMRFPPATVCSANGEFILQNCGS